MIIKETGNRVIFLRKLQPGGAEHSFGIHVARMAGMPRTLLQRATEILHELESKNVSVEEGSSTKKQGAVSRERIGNSPDMTSLQLSIFDQTDVILRQLKDELLRLDVNQMTPIQCMMKLLELKKKIESEE